MISSIEVSVITLILETLNSTTSARYLEIITDDHLSFKSHINQLESKISWSVGVIAKLSY